jgi:glucose-fructose oxidoreductase
MDQAALSRRLFCAAAAGGALSLPLIGSAASAQAGGGQPPVPPQPLPATTTRPTGRPFPQLEQPLPRVPGERLGWAVVGLGKFALGQILPHFSDCKTSTPVALVSGDPAKARDVGSRYGIDSLYSYENFRSIRDNPDIDVVYIILPNSLHAEYAIQALEAGKHVFCEKPMAISVEQCERMIAAAQRANRKLGIAYRAHWEPHNVRALEMLRAGELGTLRHFQSMHGRPLKPDEDPADQWRAKKALAGGGSLYDIGIYALNAARMFAGEEPEEVSAIINNPPGDPRFAEVEDLVSFHLRFPSGAVADCASSYSIKEEKNYQLYGTKASLRLDPATDYLHNTLMLKGEEEQREIETDPAPMQFSAEMDGFSEAVMQNREFRTPGEEGLKDVRLMQAIYRSARDGRPVKV